jgi:hypothetical protein
VKADIVNTWASSTLPGCLGHPCEMLRRGSYVARVWQASRITAHGAWCWSIGTRMVLTLRETKLNITRGNRGVAKAAARRALSLYRMETAS